MASLTIKKLAALLDAEFAGDPDVYVTRPAHPLEAEGEGAIAIATAPEFIAQLAKVDVQAAVLPIGTDWQALGLKSAIFVQRPRYALSSITKLFSHTPALPVGINPTALVDPSAKIGENVSIGPFVVIGENAVIGDNSKIFSHCNIGENVRIGENALLLNGVSIGFNVSIGTGVIIHQNAVIGADGFSFVTPDVGSLEAAKASIDSTVQTQNTAFSRISSLGAVTLGDDVEVGACTTIDRGTLKNTVVGDGTKIDNQVQIGHNVEIGGGCIICAQVGIAGAAIIGDRVMLGGKAGVADHVKIESDVLVAAASAVADNVQSGNIVMGVPAVKREQAMDTLLSIRRLPRLLKTVDRLKQALIAKKDSGQ